MKPVANPTPRQLEARRATLVQRLEDGDRRIAEAAAAGADTGPWEEFWLQLLGEYVEVSRRLLEEPMAELQAA